MNEINYDALMQKIIENHAKAGEKPKLLLHSCCAPCSSACLQRLKDHFEITVFYYNPNIDTEEEYIKRANEQKRFCQKIDIDCTVCDYDKVDFLNASKGLEREIEGGKRCFKCYALRLEKTAKFALEKGYDYFATTLTVSPLKNAKVINETGERLEKEFGVKYLPSDFKKRNGYLESIKLSKEYGLYRQNYCGCEFSKIEK